MKSKKDPWLRFCPKCLHYEYSLNRECSICGCKKMRKSVLKKLPTSIYEIPYEDLCRIITYRKTNGYMINDVELLIKTAPVIGVEIPKDDKRYWPLKNIRVFSGDGIHGKKQHFLPGKHS